MSAPRGAATQTPTEKNAQNGMFYQKSANNYPIARPIVMGILILLFGILFWRSRDRLGAENFRYFAKFWSADEAADSPFANVACTADADTVFALYAGDLAVLHGGTLSLFSADGALLLRADSGAEAAALRTDGLYMALYPSGGRSVTVLNSFSSIGEISCDDAVAAAVTSSEGLIAVCTIKKSSTVLTVYRKDLTVLFSETLFDTLALDAAFSDDGSTLAVLSLSGDSGSSETVLTVLSARDGTTLYTDTLAGQKPVSVGFFGARAYAVTEKSLIFYEKSGAERAHLRLSEKPTGVCRSGNRLLLYVSDSMFLYGDDGSLLASYACGEKITQALLGDTVYCLTDRALYAFSEDFRTKQLLSENDGVLSVFYEPTRGCVCLCRAERIEAIVP